MADTNPLPVVPPPGPTQDSAAELGQMNPNAFAEAFTGGRPKGGHLAVQNRLRRAEQLNKEIVQYIHDRLEAEDAYIRSLDKISKRNPLLGTGQGETGNLGGLEKVRNRLENELEEIINIHRTFVGTVQEEVEMPLRMKSTTGEWKRVKDHDSAMNTLVKEYEDNVNRALKSEQKVQSTPQSSKKIQALRSKLSSDQDNLDISTVTWRTEAPKIFSLYQQIDQDRLSHLKQCLIQYETLQNDLGDRRMKLAAKALEELLVFDERVDMQEFCLREGRASGGSSMPFRNVSGATTLTAAATNGRRTQGGSAGGEVPQIATNGSDMSERHTSPPLIRAPSTRSRTQDMASIHSADPAGRTPSGGNVFRSTFSSILTRNRSSSNAPGYGNLDQTPTRDTLDPSNADRETESLRQQNTGEGASQNDGFDTHHDFSPIREGAGGGAGRKIRDSFMPFMRRKGSGRENYAAAGAGVADDSGPRRSESASAFATGRDERPGTAGTGAGGDEGNRQSVFGLGRSGGGRSGSGSGSGVGAVEDRPSGIPRITTPAVDEEGFSVPPENYDRNPWETGGAALAEDEDADEATRLAASQNKVNMSIAQAPIQEADADSAAALARVQNLLSAGGPTQNPGALGRRATRGRRDVRVTTFNPIPDDIPLGKVLEMQKNGGGGSLAMPTNSSSGAFSSSPISPSSPPLSTATNNFDRSNSLLSNSSSHTRLAAAAAANPFDNPTAAGLRAAITETLNVIIQGGAISRLMITGEIALSFKEASANASPKPLHLRITNYEAFEKAAPNNVFLTPLPECAGEYELNVANLPSGPDSNAPTIVMRYQVHVDRERATEFLPINLVPQWKCEPNQTSFLLSYSINPNSTLIKAAESAPAGSKNVTDVAFVVPINSKVSTVQAKPSGSWQEDKGRMYWKLDDLPISADAPQKVLARFMVESQGSPGPVAAHWKISGASTSGVGLEIVGGSEVDGSAKFEEVVRSVVSGKHLVT